MIVENSENERLGAVDEGIVVFLDGWMSVSGAVVDRPWERSARVACSGVSKDAWADKRRNSGSSSRG
jgi:hypothetical protein